MKIKICEENIEVLDKICDKANGKATTRTISANRLIWAAESAEKFLEKLHLTKKERKGAIFSGGYHNDFAKAYFKIAFCPKGTLFKIERGCENWFLTQIEREYCVGKDQFSFNKTLAELIKGRALEYANSRDPICY